MSTENAAEGPNDLLAAFAEELRRTIRFDLEAAQAIETACWYAPLQDAPGTLGS